MQIKVKRYAMIRNWYNQVPHPALRTKNGADLIISKKINNDQELIQSDPTSCPHNKREITKYINWQQFTKGTHGKPNEQLFPR